MSQFPQHRITNSDDVRTGNAVSADRTKKGAPIAGAEAQAFVVLHLGAPAVEDPDGLAEAQAVAGAGNLVLDGAVADALTNSDGHVVLDVPRNVSIDSSDAGDTTQTATVTGYDAYGHLMIETIAFNGTTEVQGLKAFKKIVSIAISAVMAGNANAGIGKKLGLPYAPVLGGFLSGIAGENTSDAGTYAPPIRTNPATAITGDVRGTYLGAGTYNGSLQIAVRVAVQNGPNDSDLYGVEQFDG